MKPLRRDNKPFELCPAGTHIAIITVIADLGLQSITYDQAVKHQIGISYELVEETGSDGRKLAISDSYTYSSHDLAKLSGVIKSVLGEIPEECDIKELLGKVVSVTAIHREDSQGRTWANVESVGGLPAKAKQGVTTDTPLLFFDLDYPDPGVFQKLPAQFKRKIDKRVRLDEAETAEAGDDNPW